MFNIWSSGRRKLKPRRRTTTHLPECLKFKRLTTTIPGPVEQIGLARCWWGCTTTSGRSSASSSKLNICIPCDPKIPLVGITQEKWKHLSTRWLACDQSWQFYLQNPQTGDGPDAHQVGNGEANSFNGILLTNKNTNGYCIQQTWVNLKNRILKEKQRLKNLYIYDSVYMNFSNKQKESIMRMQTRGCLGWGSWGNGLQGGTEELGGWWKSSHISDFEGTVGRCLI